MGENTGWSRTSTAPGRCRGALLPTGLYLGILTVIALQLSSVAGGGDHPLPSGPTARRRSGSPSAAGGMFRWIYGSAIPAPCTATWSSGLVWCLALIIGGDCPRRHEQGLHDLVARGRAFRCSTSAECSSAGSRCTTTWPSCASACWWPSPSPAPHRAAVRVPAGRPAAAVRSGTPSCSDRFADRRQDRPAERPDLGAARPTAEVARAGHRVALAVAVLDLDWFKPSTTPTGTCSGTRCCADRRTACPGALRDYDLAGPVRRRGVRAAAAAHPGGGRLPGRGPGPGPDRRAAAERTGGRAGPGHRLGRGGGAGRRLGARAERADGRGRRRALPGQAGRPKPGRR